MKVFKKVLALIMLTSVLAFTACTPPPPPVTKNQLTVAEQEALEQEQITTQLQQEKTQLEAELRSKQAKLDALKDMEKGMN
ncbi:MAG: hypothetical protein PHY08_09080 [Candidatus Cloacimonetes bacterium]|jgi:uncharacterized protein YlxW (UPF0749 family)|nr:hypothetical protein [Candidatus Cloacimonadota bacterium]MDD4156710.1 hypothetical protein [Candidatus Cloacimonadota bacterium]